MPLKKYTDPKAWWRALARVSVHAGVGAILATFGTNGAENLAPHLLEGVGMNLKQAVAVFLSSAMLAALKFIHEQTDGAADDATGGGAGGAS